jgi:hypothetical protein
MIPLPYDGTAEAGLSGSLLRFVQDDRQTEQLREVLSGFSHRCRNLLNGMRMSLYFVRRGADEPLPPRWAEVEQTYRSIELLFERLQSIYRPMSLTLVRAPFGSLVRDRERKWREWIEAGGGTLEILPPARESPGEFDPMNLGMGLDALVSWRSLFHAPHQSARLSWRTGEGHFEVNWTESPPPRPGACVTNSPGGPKPIPSAATTHSLALPLLARVMTAHHGLLNWDPRRDFEVTLRWPLVQPRRPEAPSG